MPGPVRSSQRQPNRGLGGNVLRSLPAAGRDGDPPKWPLTGRAPKAWGELWRLPQAIAWEELHLERVVGRYCQKLVLSEKRDAPASLCAEVRQLEDRLGLSPMALLRLRWVVEVAPASANAAEVAGVTSLDRYRDALA